MKQILLTKAEYARKRGVTQAAVSKAIAEGRITVMRDSGREMIDPIAADAQWAANSRRRAPQAVHAATAAPVGSVSVREDPRHVREVAEAQMAVIRLGELRGDLIRVDAVKAALAKTFIEVRERFLSIPARVAPILAATTEVDEVARLLDSEIRDALIAASRDPFESEPANADETQ